MISFKDKCHDKKVMAVLMAALVAACCLTPIIVNSDDSSADGGNGTFTINMRVGDSFSYTATTNLGSNVTASGTALSNGWSFNTSTKVLSGTPTTAGTYSVTLTATSTVGLSQTAECTINFVVAERVAISSATTDNAVVGTAYSYTLTWLGSQNATVGTPTFTDNTDNWLSWNAATKTLSGTPTASGTTSVSISVNDTTTPSNSATLNLSVHIYDDVAITSDTEVDTVVGRSFEYEMTTNYDDDSDATITKTMDITALSGKGSPAFDFTSPNLTGTFLASAASSVTPFYTDYIVTMVAAGTVDGESVTTGNTNLKIRVYAELSFTTAPSISDVEISSDAESPKDICIAANVSGATSITYYWGDGTQTSIPVSQANTVCVASHTYAESDVYEVRIKAENTVETTNSIVMYDASTGEHTFAAASGGVDDQSGSEDNDDKLLLYGAIVASAIAIITIIAMLYFGFASVFTYIVLAVSAVVAIVLFCMRAGVF